MSSAGSPNNGTTRHRPSIGKRVFGATDTTGVDPHRVIGAALAVLAIVLIVQNSSSTELHFLIFSFQAPVWVMCITTLVLGGVA